MSDNNGGFLGGLAGAVKPEEKHINTPAMARWEDFWRIIAQTFGMAGLRIGQSISLLFVLGAWAYTAAQFYTTDSGRVMYHDQLYNLLQYIFAGIFIVIYSLIVYALREALEGGLFFTVAFLALIIDGLLIAYIAPVIAWAIMNLIAWGKVPLGQLLSNGALPVGSAILAFAIVKDFQDGRTAFRNELIDQIGTNDPGVINNRANIAWEREKADRTNNATIELEEAREQIEALREEIKRLESLPARKEFVPANHGSARAAYGNVTMSGDDQIAMMRFINGWSTRGTSRDEWTGNKDQQAAGTHISQPQWEKITRALKNVHILDDNNQPMMSAEQAFIDLKLSQNPPPLL